MPCNEFPIMTPELYEASGLKKRFAYGGVDLANGPDCTVYPDGRVEPNPEYEEEES